MNLSNNVNRIIGNLSNKIKCISFLSFSSKTFTTKFPTNANFVNNNDMLNIKKDTYEKLCLSKKLNLKITNENLKLGKFATSKDGNYYENEVYKKLIKIFGKSNIIRERDISKILYSFNNHILKSKLNGIDFIINTNYNNVNTLFAIQIKVGARKCGNKDVVPFIRTLKILRQFVKKNKEHFFYQKNIIPIWVSSTQLNNYAKENLINNNIYCCIDPLWSIDIDNCNLFANFIKILDINIKFDKTTS